jgi:glutathione synthase/RimK-type ligase-like ATP-grasp enzyme
VQNELVNKYKYNTIVTIRIIMTMDKFVMVQEYLEDVWDVCVLLMDSAIGFIERSNYIYEHHSKNFKKFTI